MSAVDETRRDLEIREDASLAPCAMRSAGATRPRRLDPEGRVFDYRTEYQRDRDRILHSRAFRRLRLKGEGWSPGPPDQLRDRLSHTLEVAQMARTVARALSLNEDLTEAIALGHDLGSPPFGREGAAALDGLLASLPRHLSGRFRIPDQSLRVVDLLEKRYAHAGLNLTQEVRAGILRLGEPAPGQVSTRDSSRGSGTSRRRGRPARSSGSGSRGCAAIEPDPVDRTYPPSLEAQAVAVSDRIASAIGELDDAFRSGGIEPASVERLPIVRALIRRLGGRYPARSRGTVFTRANLIHRGLTHLLVSATIQSSRRTIRDWSEDAGVSDHESFLEARRSLPSSSIGMDDGSLGLFEGLREALLSLRQASDSAAQSRAWARKILASLLEAYRSDPRLVDDYVLLRFKEVAGVKFLRDLPRRSMETEIARRYHASGVFVRLVADHLAGMTDAFACSEYARLLGSFPAPGGVSSLM
jgi:dGTPase